MPVAEEVSVTNPSATTATITWTTREPSSTLVKYGTSASYGRSSLLDPTPGSIHTVVLTGLIPNTVYHFQVQSARESSLASTSGDFTFTIVASLPRHHGHHAQGYHGNSRRYRFDREPTYIER